MDGFERVNELVGPPAATPCSGCSQRLTLSVRETMCSRVDGDAFAVLVGPRQHGRGAPDRAPLLGAVRRPIGVDGREVT